jgi:uncharacterized Tic20 family protein
MANHAETVQDSSSTVLGVVTVVAALPIPVIFPLVMWLAQRNQNAKVEQIAKEVLNFQLSFIVGSIAVMIGLMVLSAVGTFVASWLGALFGVTMMVLAYVTLGISYLVFMVKAAIKASKNEVYRFPFTVRLIG